MHTFIIVCMFNGKSFIVQNIINIDDVGAKAGENLLGVEVGGSCIIWIVADNSNVLPC